MTEIRRFLDQFDKQKLLREFDIAFDAVSASQTGLPAPAYKPVEKPKRLVFPYLYLPVEVKARELASKALIAKEAKSYGFTVLTGASWSLNAWIPYLPPGIALLKSSNAVDATNIINWVRSGSLTAVLDEEIFGIAPTPAYLSATLHPYTHVR
jgi:hypothetical protein